MKNNLLEIAEKSKERYKREGELKKQQDEREKLLNKLARDQAQEEIDGALNTFIGVNGITRNGCILKKGIFTIASMEYCYKNWASPSEPADSSWKIFWKLYDEKHRTSYKESYLVETGNNLIRFAELMGKHHL